MKTGRATLSISIALGLFHVSSAQENIYLPQDARVYTHSDVQVAIFGNIINDAQGGLNHNDGGTLYLYRDSSSGNGSSEILDGPYSPTPSGNYNENGSYIRVYDLVTDNTTGTSVPSGTQINTNSGSAEIQVRQELKITHSHKFVNGNIWTPRGDWKHAYVTYEDSASYSGVSANNVDGLHIDGYAAYTGNADFIFPIGDGFAPRMSGIRSPQSGKYKAAYFDRDAQSGTAGISGISADSSLAGDIIVVHRSEFWDIDGTAETYIVLSSSNTGRNTSDWPSQFPNFGNQAEMSIVAWDAWESIGIDAQPSGLYQDGFFTSARPVNPDLGGNAGNPFGAFTWGLVNKNSLGIKDLQLHLSELDCHAKIDFTTTAEENTSHASIMRSENNGVFAKVGQVTLHGNTSGETKYSFVDLSAEVSRKYFYRIDVVDNSSQTTNSEVKSLTILCSDQVIWKLFPNPSFGHIKIESNYAEPITAIKVFDAAGKLVYVETVPPNANNNFSREIDLTALSTGMYHVTVENEIGHTVKSFKLGIVD